MDALALLTDLAGRPRTALTMAQDRITPENANIHPCGHDNSIAWLLWHTGREIDVQLAHLAKTDEVWNAAGFREHLSLGDLGDTVGYGHASEQARSIVVEDTQLLLDYVFATLDALEAYLKMLAVSDLDDVVDDRWDPAVTRGVRLVSIIDDAVAHIAQVAYICGMDDLSR